MSKPEMWHRIVVGGGIETATIAGLLSDALMRNRHEMNAHIKTLRETGFGGAFQSKVTRIELRDLEDTLYLNDGALSLYRSLGGNKVVDETLNSLPNHPSLGSLISDEWREVQQP
jgi:hypothetical protein